MSTTKPLADIARDLYDGQCRGNRWPEYVLYENESETCYVLPLTITTDISWFRPALIFREYKTIAAGVELLLTAAPPDYGATQLCGACMSVRVSLYGEYEFIEISEKPLKKTALPEIKDCMNMLCEEMKGILQEQLASGYYKSIDTLAA
jgi:hypothetical protein